MEVFLLRSTYIQWKKIRGKEPEKLRLKEHFSWFWGCPGEGSFDDRFDFKEAGSSTPTAGTTSIISL